jgi:hypothetical protein
MARCTCEGREGSCSGVRWRNPTARANTAYPPPPPPLLLLLLRRRQQQHSHGRQSQQGLSNSDLPGLLFDTRKLEKARTFIFLVADPMCWRKGNFQLGWTLYVGKNWFFPKFFGVRGASVKNGKIHNVCVFQTESNCQ